MPSRWCKGACSAWGRAKPINGCMSSCPHCEPHYASSVMPPPAPSRLWRSGWASQRPTRRRWSRHGRRSQRLSSPFPPPRRHPLCPCRDGTMHHPPPRPSSCIIVKARAADGSCNGRATVRCTTPPKPLCTNTRASTPGAPRAKVPACPGAGGVLPAWRSKTCHSTDVDGWPAGRGAAVQYRLVTCACTERRVGCGPLPPPLHSRRLVPARERSKAVTGAPQRRPPAPAIHHKVTDRGVADPGHGGGAHVPCRMIGARGAWG